MGRVTRPGACQKQHKSSEYRNTAVQITTTQLTVVCFYQYLGLLKDGRVIHGQLARHALHEISTSDGNQCETTAENFELPYSCYDVITAMTTKHQQLLHSNFTVLHRISLTQCEFMSTIGKQQSVLSLPYEHSNSSVTSQNVRQTMLLSRPVLASN